MTGTNAAYELVGEIDAHTAPLHLAEIDPLIRDQGSHRVVIDMSRTRMVDSTGLGMLVNAQKACNSRGKRLVLRGADHRLVRLMEIAGTHNMFDWEP